MRDAVVRTMNVPTSKDAASGIRRAVARGMRAGGPGFPEQWVGPDSDGAKLDLFVMQAVALVLPEPPESQAVWEPLEMAPMGVVAVSLDETIAHEEVVELSDGVHARHCFLLEGRALGEATVTTRLVAPDGSEKGSFSMTVVVKPR